MTKRDEVIARLASSKAEVPDGYLTTLQVSDAIGLSRRQTAELIRRSCARRVKCSGTIYYDGDAFADWYESWRC